MDSILADLCKQLRLSGVYAYVLDYQPNNEDVLQFLTSALQSELDKRHLSRQMRALQQAGFPTKKRFVDLLMDDLPQDGREAIPELKALTFLKEKRNVILIGNSGTGKQFKKIELLIIDELGYVTFDLAAAELLFQLLAARYETMSTIITSNLGFSDWVKVFMTEP